MDDAQLQRYARQILLPQVDIAGQERLLGAHALILGLGGLGSPVALYLASAGVGRLTLVDDDVVSLSNLQRQILHRTADVGRAKTESARDALTAINPDVALELVPCRLSGAELRAACASADVVVDACDNFAARHEHNRVCVQSATPLVWGAAERLQGQAGVVDRRHPEAGCYRCFQPDNGAPDTPCNTLGVFTPLVGIIGSIMANEALKILLGGGETLAGRTLLLDAWNLEFHSFRLPRRADCPVCGAAAARTAQSTR
ncbi:HesA/MoeB/ThiF family protein [Magnetofaba australis]|uniref:Putative molybdopterin synthase sulfurylase n=1 Tax=Magnetofaba australis IT-1 TaxID=1434232 RepID=A0A1Y2K2H7_9PROT|nr:HesA/MoeB/ThiF family protein [Magnetofaba australis]OSM02241.1 putative molybdopterin synthase sulfurylase [Magnetofaba australis IT-1]